ELCFEWNRTLFSLDGQTNHLLEKLYRGYEAIITPGYHKIKSQGESIRYDINDFFHLLLLVSLTYSRQSLNEEEAKNLVQSTPNQAIFLKILQRSTSKELSKDSFAWAQRELGYLPISQLLLPALDFLALDMNSAVDHWTIYAPNQQAPGYIIGDHPILLKTTPKKNVLESELIFPLTKKLILHHHPGKKIKKISPASRIHLDVMIFLQSQRYVAGPSRAYLEFIQSLAQTTDTKQKMETLRKALFR
ncbi:MAG: DUF4238 domain-containing protein, partial [Bacteroidota bacterium]